MKRYPRRLEVPEADILERDLDWRPTSREPGPGLSARMIKDGGPINGPKPKVNRHPGNLEALEVDRGWLAW